MKLVCVGDCGIDDYETTGDRLPGGITYNFAVRARRAFPASDRIRVISALGTDPAAIVVRNALKVSGVESDLTTLEGATPVQRIALETSGERRFIGYDAGVLEGFRPSAAQIADIEQADWLVMPHFVQIAGLFDALLQLPRHGALAVDFADFAVHPDFELLERSLEQVDVAFFGLQPENTVTLGRIERLARERDRLLVVTLGATGSRAYAGREQYDREAVRVPVVVDTTGAGDAFAAGFLSLYCHGAAVPACLEAGARLAATAILQVGGVSA